MIDRRTFLRRLGFGTVAAAAAATSVFDLEKLLWVPGEKTIILPAVKVFHRNTFVTPDWVVREALKHYKHNISLIAAFNRPYSAEW